MKIKSQNSGLSIGVDLGGTKIEVVGLNSHGLVRDRRRIETPQGSYGGTVQAIVNLIHEIERGLGEEGTVGIGIPGVISAESGLVKNANSTWLNDHPLGEDLSAALGRPIRIANDANCFALSEATDGAAEGAQVVFGVILGTGVGGGLVVNRQIVAGANLIAGEWGHNPLPWPGLEETPGLKCYCGLQGCIETYLSGPGMTKAYKALAGAKKSPDQIAALANKGDGKAVQVLHEYENRLARALATIINVVDPDVIVLGGGLSNLRNLYQRVPDIWGQYVFSDTVRTELLPAEYGDSSGVRGAAWLWSAKDN